MPGSRTDSANEILDSLLGGGGELRGDEHHALEAWQRQRVRQRAEHERRLAAVLELIPHLCAARPKHSESGTRNIQRNAVCVGAPTAPEKESAPTLWTARKERFVARVKAKSLHGGCLTYCCAETRHDAPSNAVQVEAGLNRCRCVGRRGRMSSAVRAFMQQSSQKTVTVASLAAAAKSACALRRRASAPGTRPAGQTANRWPAGAKSMELVVKIWPPPCLQMSHQQPRKLLDLGAMLCFFFNKKFSNFLNKLIKKIP